MRARTPPVLAAAAAMGVVGLAAPATADAHAIGTVTYQSPVPLWQYVLAGAIAVAASVPVAALEVVSRQRAAVWVQAPLIALMVAYTELGLWILGQASTSG